jgi:hypothetical protein
MFGGAGHYIREIKKRHTFDDLLLFDPVSNRWFDPQSEKEHPGLHAHRVLHANSQHFDDLSLPSNLAAPPPMKRLGHAAAILGNCLVVHGGINGEENQPV